MVAISPCAQVNGEYERTGARAFFGNEFVFACVLPGPPVCSRCSDADTGRHAGRQHAHTRSWCRFEDTILVMVVMGSDFCLHVRSVKFDFLLSLFGKINVCRRQPLLHLLLVNVWTFISLCVCVVGEDAFVIDLCARVFPRLIYRDWFNAVVMLPWAVIAAHIGRVSVGVGVCESVSTCV